MTEQSFEGITSSDDKLNVSEVLPEHECTAQLTKMLIKETQRGGKGAQNEWTLLDGPCNGRKIFQWINLEVPPKSNSEEDRKKAATAAASGLAEMGRIRVALYGTAANLKTPAEYLYRPCRVKIGHKKEDDELKNVIKKYTFLGTLPATPGGSVPPATPTPTTPPTTPAANGDWK